MSPGQPPHKQSKCPELGLPFHFEASTPIVPAADFPWRFPRFPSELTASNPDSCFPPSACYSAPILLRRFRSAPFPPDFTMSTPTYVSICHPAADAMPFAVATGVPPPWAGSFYVAPPPGGCPPPKQSWPLSPFHRQKIHLGPLIFFFSPFFCHRRS